MQRTKDKKAFMLHQKGRNLRREAKHIGHLLSLVTNEEDDARLWEKYSKILKRSCELEIISGYGREDSDFFNNRMNCKPVFDDTYISCTTELKRLYNLLSVTDDPKQRRRLYEEINAKKKERWESSSYIDRETGRPVKVYVGENGEVNFVYDDKEAI